MRLLAAGVLAAVALVGCGGGGDASSPLDVESGEGFAGAPAPRLDVVGLGEVVEVADAACIVRYEVDPAGRVAGQRYHVTLHLAADLGSAADLSEALAGDGCSEERAAAIQAARERLGNVGAAAFEFSYVGANGARYRLD